MSFLSQITKTHNSAPHLPKSSFRTALNLLCAPEAPKRDCNVNWLRSLTILEGLFTKDHKLKTAKLLVVNR